MKTKLKKLSALLLALGTLFILSFPNIAHAEDTGDSGHFQLTVIENKDSKSGAEVADLTVKNISGKTGENVTFEADLPTIFHDKDMKKATFNVGTLMAGESKTYQVSRKSDGTVTTNPLPITGNNSTTSALPKTGDVAPPLFIAVGLFLVAGIVIIGFKRFRGAKSLFAIMLLLAGVCGTVTVNASEKSYHHRDEVRNHAVALSGTTYVFHLAANGDFEDDDTDTGDNSGNTGGDNGGSEVMKNFTITYYIKGAKVTGLAPDGYTTGDKTIALPKPKLVGDEFLGWYDNDTYTGHVIENIAKEATGDKIFYGKTTPRAHQVTFDLTGGYFPDTTATILDVDHGDKVSQPTNPVKDDIINETTITSFSFAGWFTADNQAFSFDTLITETTTLHAKWDETSAAKVTVTFRNYDDTGNDVLPQKSMKLGENLGIPDAPKENYYFLGWAESPSVGKTETLYVPDASNIQGKLNESDQAYLGYSVKSEHEIANLMADKTLYAVYYKQLKATSLADVANPTAQEFIWNDAIWRVVNTVERWNTNNRLVVKVSALTEDEVVNQLGIPLENSGVTHVEEIVEGALGVHFLSQTGATDTDNETYYFNGAANDNGYERSRLKTIIDIYYNQLGDKTAVQAVTLNMPTLMEYLNNGVGGFIGNGSTYNSWEWSRDAEDGNRQRFYRDARFETMEGGTKQAFALSHGDIHGALGIPTTSGNNKVSLLNFSETNVNFFWLRSAGNGANSAGLVARGGDVGGGYGMDGRIPVRPALYLSVD